MKIVSILLPIIFLITLHTTCYSSWFSKDQTITKKSDIILQETDESDNDEHDLVIISHKNRGKTTVAAQLTMLPTMQAQSPNKLEFSNHNTTETSNLLSTSDSNQNDNSKQSQPESLNTYIEIVNKENRVNHIPTSHNALSISQDSWKQEVYTFFSLCCGCFQGDNFKNE